MPVIVIAWEDEMSFTDEELKRLKRISEKESMSYDTGEYATCWALRSLPGLLDRLEAAEGFIAVRGKGEGPKDAAMKKWRKAAGK